MVDHPSSNPVVLSGRQLSPPLDVSLLTPLGYLPQKPMCISSVSVIVPDRLLGVHILPRSISLSHTVVVLV